ncbi:glycosyltransferase family 39 protein [Campylobacter sp. faydin G-24]|uniref:Glycosyltransferase family 39 protein n=1 Tax=Campylobacter anatolicus TaxID=2829105 RepID=A0ABS5HL87_9BACT|nr:glycosyltransferase family 39 protein [Campylobacter anatolicus]MBR8464532.1 glycosyltransferase family 39 protein [Campylobacter anatolicus]
MRELMLRHKNLTLTLICLIDALFLVFCVSNLSISYYEASIFFEKNNAISYIIRASCAVFGRNDFALRLPMIIFNILSIILLYKISKFYIKFEFDRIVSVILFVLLPGTLTSGVVVDNAGFCMMLTLLVVYLYHSKFYLLFYIVFISLVTIDGDFMVLYLAFFFFATNRKNIRLAWVSGLLLLFSFYLFGFDTRGRPSGHFIDTFGIFAAVFSPFVFLFFIYTLYRIWVKESKELLWFIAASSFCFCMIISIRQRLQLEEFLPFCLIATPIMVRVFFNSYRVRLPQFRKKYKIFTALVLVFLYFNSITLALNPLLYTIMHHPDRHFAYKFHVVRELSDELKKLGETDIYVRDYKLGLRLKFYGIYASNSAKKELIDTNLDKTSQIKIEKFDKLIASFDIVPI